MADLPVPHAQRSLAGGEGALLQQWDRVPRRLPAVGVRGFKLPHCQAVVKWGSSA
jgi:hypothetical protein